MARRLDPIRVLIVDDSAVMRKIIARLLSEDPDIEVIGQAADAACARAAIKSLDPDVVTLDIQMPGMNGLDFLQKIMELRPTPVIIISSIARDRDVSTASLALKYGAVDYIAKPDLRDGKYANKLTEKIKAAVGSSQRQATLNQRQIAAKPRLGSRPNLMDNVIAIGSSTGGVEALIAILSEFPENCPPTVITQHMPGGFTRSFAKRLNRLCSPRVTEAADGDLLLPGQIYIAPGGTAHLQVAGTKQFHCQLVHADTVSGHRPSIDVLFNSVAKAAGAKSIGVILTGMGHDGAAGLLSMRQAGARTIGQDEKSCVIYGMSKSAAEMGAVEKELSLDAIATEIFSPRAFARALSA